MRKKHYLVLVPLTIVFCLMFPAVFSAGNIPQQTILKAKDELRTGVNTWDPETMKRAKDMFLGLLLRKDPDAAWLHYYIALSDYRLATYYLEESQSEEAELHTMEAQKHLDKVIELKPDWGEPFALYASTLGYEIALDWSKAMSLGMKIGEYYGIALELEPDNPRVNLLKGAGELYTPVEYGGGPDIAIATLSHAVSLFENEKAAHPKAPSWGKEEAYTFLGMAHQQKGENEKARELYQKALKVNPDFGLAKESLQALKK
jgi:tetratricopeptide (TPR) repeat protein